MPTPIISLDRSKFSPSLARRKALAAIRSTVRGIAWDIKRHIMADMRAPKHGRAYRKPDGRIHIASSPGESPAVDTGALINSLDVSLRTVTGGSEARIGTDMYYAGWLEEGTEDGNLLPRPFAEPAARAFRQQFIDALRDNITAAINGEESGGYVAVTPDF